MSDEPGFAEHPAYVAWRDVPFPSGTVGGSHELHHELATLDVWVANALLPYAQGRLTDWPVPVRTAIGEIAEKLKTARREHPEDASTIDAYAAYFELLEDAFDAYSVALGCQPAIPRAIWDREEVRYPTLRLMIVGAVQGLTDTEYQQRVWIRHELPHPGYYDEFNNAVHTLFDDTEVLPDPAESIGITLLAGEVAAMHALGVVLDPLIDDLGDVPDADYLADPRWTGVVDAAGVALAAFGMRAPHA